MSMSSIVKQLIFSPYLIDNHQVYKDWLNMYRIAVLTRDNLSALQHMSENNNDTLSVKDFGVSHINNSAFNSWNIKVKVNNDEIRIIMMIDKNHGTEIYMVDDPDTLSVKTIHDVLNKLFFNLAKADPLDVPDGFKSEYEKWFSLKYNTTP